MKLRHVVIVATIALMLLLVGCGKEAPEPEPEPALEVQAPEPAPEPEPQPEVEEVEEVILEQGGDITEEAEMQKGSKGLAVDITADDAFPQAGCELKEVDGKEKLMISVKIKNIENEDWVIYGKENPKGKVRIGTRGVLDILAGCESWTLAPGEETLCNEIDMGVISGENRITVNTPGQQYARVVECP